jgi:UPF0755 protein
MFRAGSNSNDVLKRILLLLAAVLLLLGVSARYGWERYDAFLQTPLNIPASGQVFQLERGASGVDIVQQLGLLGLTRPGWEWRLLMRLEPHVYRAGEYRLAAGITPQQVLGTLSSGQVVQYRVTLVEGWTFLQFAAALDANAILQHELDLKAPAQWPSVAAGLGIDHLEGWFLPETYHFTRGDSDHDVLVRAHAAMQQALAQAWESRIEDLPIDSPYELLILASII